MFFALIVLKKESLLVIFSEPFGFITKSYIIPIVLGCAILSTALSTSFELLGTSNVGLIHHRATHISRAKSQPGNIPT